MLFDAGLQCVLQLRIVFIFRCGCIDSCQRGCWQVTERGLQYSNTCPRELCSASSRRAQLAPRRRDAERRLGSGIAKSSVKAP